MRAVLQAANKGRDTREEREQLVAAAEQGDIGAAFLGIVEITKDLKILRDRLERVAADAEMDDQRLAVVSASSAQLRAAEVRAKLSGVGGYATPRSDKPTGAPFVLNINFSGGRTTRIEGTPMHPDDPAFNALPTMPLSIEGPQGGSSEDEAMFDEDV